MKEILERAERELNESSLSRLWRHNDEHDCGALTAWRRGEDCGEGRKFSKKENAARNKSLLAKLMSKGYSVTKLHGTYKEGGEVKEMSFFVVDQNDTGSLPADLRKLGIEFEQDSVLIAPKGAVQGNATAYLLGTNKCENNWLGFGQKDKFSKAKFGYSSPIYTTRVNGRPFLFEEVVGEAVLPNTGFGNWSMQLAAQKHWTELIELVDTMEQGE